MEGFYVANSYCRRSGVSKSSPEPLGVVRLMGLKVTGIATLSDHKAAERRAKNDLRTQRTIYVVNAPVPSSATGATLPCPYLLPAFATREEAQTFRRERSLDAHSITELVVTCG